MDRDVGDPVELRQLRFSHMQVRHRVSGARLKALRKAPWDPCLDNPERFLVK